MTAAATVAQYVTAAAFAALGVAVTYRWYHDRRPAQARLAVALGGLALVAVIGRLGPVAQWPPISMLTIVAFIVSAYFVFLFRNVFIPVGRYRQLAARILFGVATVSGVLLVVVQQSAPRAVTTAILFVYVGAWAIFIGEPIVRFWLASNQLPAVQKMRLRFLSFGFALLVAIVLVATLGGSILQSSTGVLITQVVALASVPLIYVSFAPPALLRRLWRMSEEAALRDAMQDLLIFSPSRQVLAERAIFWGVRMMGASAGFVVDADGKIMATTGIDKAKAATLSSRPDPKLAAEAVITAPLHLSDGLGKLAIVAGPFTPVFGTDEISQLNAYANSVTAGLERARVTERMAAIESNKTQFLNLASHELRGPVTVIRGYVSMLQDGLLGVLNERGKKAAGVMAAKVSEMNELIEEMIDAARLEDGGLTLRPVESDLREIARAAAEVVSPMLDGSHRIIFDLPERRVRVNVDPDRTRTIIANLLSNAIKYSPQGGQITCSVRSRAGTARLAVIDEGLGIGRQDLPRLFTRFGRIITPETEHLKGTGLGLFLSRQLARLQGGEITVVSELGKGSTFTLQLPTSAVHEGEAKGDDEEVIARSQATAS